MTSGAFWERLVGERYAAVREAALAHQAQHGCDAFPTGRLTAAVVQWLVGLTGAGRVVELGTGLGYLALHIADALPASGRLETIEHDPRHAELAAAHVRAAGHAERIAIHVGEAHDVLPRLDKGAALVVDDAWFVRRPPWLDSVLGLLAPGGLLVETNWFALEAALSGGASSHPEWTARYGPDWPRHLEDYARELAERGDLDATLLTEPAMMLVRRRRPSSGSQAPGDADALAADVPVGR